MHCLCRVDPVVAALVSEETTIVKEYLAPFQVLDKVCSGLVSIGSTVCAVPGTIDPHWEHSTAGRSNSSRSAALLDSGQGDGVSWLWGAGQQEVLDWLYRMSTGASTLNKSYLLSPLPSTSHATPPSHTAASRSPTPTRQLFTRSNSRCSRSPPSPITVSPPAVPTVASGPPALTLMSPSRPQAVTDALSDGLADARAARFPVSALHSTVVTLGAAVMELRATWRRGDWASMRSWLAEAETALVAASQQLHVDLSSSVIVGSDDCVDRSADSPDASSVITRSPSVRCGRCLFLTYGVCCFTTVFHRYLIVTGISH